MQLGWIEAAIRYAGRFTAPEKVAYGQIFGFSDPTISRHQRRFVEVFEEACGQEMFQRDRSDRLLRGGLLLSGDANLPHEQVFERVPGAERWLEDALGSARYHTFEIGREDPAPNVLRALIRAIQDKRPLGITYHSRRAKSDRSISPHVIVKVANRMHVRGWDHAKNSYRDFVISRIASVRKVSDAEVKFIDHNDDVEWRKLSTIIIEDVKNDDQILREGARRDYKLDKFGKRVIRVRRAVAPYLVDNFSDGFSKPVSIRQEKDW